MAQLPIFQSDSQAMTLLQNKWSSILNPVLSNPITQGTLIKNVALASGDNVINHLQGQTPNGYLLVGMRDAFRQVYQVTSPTPTLTLVLNSNGACHVDLWIF